MSFFGKLGVQNVQFNIVPDRKAWYGQVVVLPTWWPVATNLLTHFDQLFVLSVSITGNFAGNQLFTVRADGQYAILSLAWFTEPLLDIKKERKVRTIKS